MPQTLTLSGLLNFIDGLWSSCGDERIIIFTTNHKERLDPALLRPGRMDVHVHMSYCTPCGFRLLAANYLGIKDHSLFAEIEQQISSTEVTPAEVAEELIKSDDPEVSLQGLIEFLKLKKKESEEAKVKKEKEAADKKDVEPELKAEEGKSINDKAKVAEELIKSDHLENALQGIVDLLKVGKKENGKAMLKKEKDRAGSSEEGDEKDVEAESRNKEVKNVLVDSDT